MNFSKKYFKENLNSIDWNSVSRFFNSKIAEEILNEYRGYFNWDLLSQNTNLEWSLELIKRFQYLWNWGELSSNEKLCWSTGLIIYFKDFWNWKNLFDNPSTPFTWNLYKKFEKTWNISEEEAIKRVKKANDIFLVKTKFVPSIITSNQIEKGKLAYNKDLKKYFHFSWFLFGKHEGKTIYELIKTNEIDYLIWCLYNLSHVVYDPLIIEDIGFTFRVEQKFLKNILNLNNDKLDLLNKQENHKRLSYSRKELLNDLRNSCPYCGESPCRCGDPF
jgi:hypothetical protein